MNHDLELILDAKNYFLKKNVDHLVLKAMKTKPDARLPQTHHLYPSVWNLFIPMFDNQLQNYLYPDEDYILDLGYKIIIPEGYVALITGTSFDEHYLSLKVLTKIWTYNDRFKPLTITVRNESENVLQIPAFDYIAQMVFVKYDYTFQSLYEITDLE